MTDYYLCIIFYFVRSVNPATAIHEQCQVLVQMGRTHEINQILHEMGLSLPQQQQLQYQPGVVNYPAAEGNRM